MLRPYELHSESANFSQILEKEKKNLGHEGAPSQPSVTSSGHGVVPHVTKFLFFFFLQTNKIERNRN